MLTSEMSALQCLMSKSNLEENNFCLIDLGHATTKVYFFHQKRIISNHISTIGGQVVDENISNTYDIPMGEVSIFKHQNSFFLTENQFDDVDEDKCWDPHCTDMIFLCLTYLRIIFILFLLEQNLTNKG